MKQPQEKETRLFKNPVLEFFTYTSLPVTLAAYSIYMAAFLFLNFHLQAVHWPLSLVLFLSGVFLWTFLEYVLHRFVFHWSSGLPIIKRFTYIVHGVHHEDPHDEARVFMPPLPGLIITLILFGIYYLFVPFYAYMLIAGNVFGYIIYSCIHYMIHVKQVPGFLKKLHTHHALHHYRYHDKAFGVSTMLWDRVFGTMAPEEERVHGNGTGLMKE